MNARDEATFGKAFKKMDDKGYFEEFQAKQDIDPDAISFVVISIPNRTVYPYDCQGGYVPGMSACREPNCPNLKVPAGKATAENCRHAVHIKNFQHEAARLEHELSENLRTLMIKIK